VEATRAEVLAHRAAAQDLHGGAAVATLDVLALGFVDSPPKTGGAGLAVRVGPYFPGSGMGAGRSGTGGHELGLDRPNAGAPGLTGPDGPGSPGLDGPWSAMPEPGRSGLGGPGSDRPGPGGSALDRPGLDGPITGRPDLGGPPPSGAHFGGPEVGGRDFGVPGMGGPGPGERDVSGPVFGGSDLAAADLGGRVAGGSERGGVGLERLVRVLSLRGAPHLHRAADLPVLRRELRPRTAEQLAAWVGGFPVPELEPLDLLVELLHREFPGERATKGELSAAVSPLLPADWTPWCERCGVRHVMDGLFRLGTLLAGLELEHVGARLVFRAPSGGVPAVEAEGESTLVRAYARLVGAFAKADAVKWLGMTPSGWPEGLRPVVVEGRKLLAVEDVVEAPPPPAGLLLFPRDPYLLGPRWLVAPDAAVARRVWRAVGSPGALVVRGEVVGDWRYAFSGRTVVFHVRGWRKVRGEARKSVREQAELLAAVWGGSALEPDVVEWAAS